VFSSSVGRSDLDSTHLPHLFTQLLPLECIHLDVAVDQQNQLLHYLADLFETYSKHTSPNSPLNSRHIYQQLFEREQLASTALGNQVALPHGRIKHLQQPMCAFIRLVTPLPYDAPDSLPIRYIFSLLVPEHANQHHLDLLAEIAYLLSDDEARLQFQQAKSAQALKAWLATWQ
jgi:PTS system nitrogen regulatory IIA component